MALSAGTRLGVYEIVAALGAGGMGEVYRATDTKLGRQVAVKVLPEALAADPERVARFEREARALAALNHQHIAALYGFDRADAHHFLVMELVEGETLADRVARGPIAPADAIPIAVHIAEALEAAHEKGIVHRDLKPANVKITPDERVKVLDFGLAKAMEPSGLASGSGPGVTQSPTLSLMATQAGLILGTAAYMSPEQAKGLPADQRSDIFSFGVVLYEMLTGRQPFRGETAAEVLASVMIREADVATLPGTVHPRLHDLIKRCLQKNPKQRWQHIGDVRSELETIAASPHVTVAAPHAAVPRPLWKRSIAPIVSALVVGALAAAAAWMLKPSPRAMVARFPIVLPENQQFTNTGRQVVAISPDGTNIVYVANQRLYLRPTSDLEARPIPGTETHSGVLHPAFAPDGQSIAFWAQADSTIKRIALSGGAPVTVCQVAAPYGLTWDAGGILFGQSGRGIMRVAANGGKPELVIATKDDEQAHGPQMLPDGRTVLFTLAVGTTPDRWDKAHIVVQSLKTGERKTLVEGGSDARYLPTGHIVYALSGVLFAIPFDAGRLQVSGGPVPVIEGVRRSGGATTGTSHFSVSTNGSIVYVPGPATTSTTQVDIAMFDRKNGAVEPLKLPPAAYETPRVSPDGRQIAFGTNDGKEAIVWIYDLAGTTSMRRLTFGGRNRFPIWSADGQHVAFQSDRDGDLAIFWQRADGTGTAERLTRAEQGTAHTPDSWARSGDRFFYDVTKGNVVSLWAFSMSGRKAERFDAVESSVLTGAVLSPDGRWIAYASRESGRSAVVYVQPFPATGAKYQISPNAEDGHHPVWSPDGAELFFVPGPGRFSVSTVTTKPSFVFSTPAAAPRQFLINSPAVVRTYDLVPDGKRFVGTIDAAASAVTAGTQQIQVVLGWFEELKQRAPNK